MRALIVWMAVCVSFSAYAVDFHVAPGGRDGNPGTEAAPFATPSAARDAVRGLKSAGGLPEGGVTLWLHEGTYTLSQTFALGAEDSGEAGRPVVYRAAGNKGVILSGGLEIPAGAWAGVTDAATLERMDPGARETVRCANLKTLGMTDYPTLPDIFESAPVAPELFFNDARMTLARWPNEGWAEIEKVIDSGPAPWRNHESNDKGTFEYAGDRPSRWTKAPAVWLQGYWCFDWSCDTIKIGQLDTAQKRITFASPHHYGIGSGNKAKRRYFALNLLEELDAPGEYYLDAAEGILYFWPPAPLEEVRAVVSVLTEPVISLDDVSDVTLRGLTVETCAGTGIRVRGGHDDAILACRVRNTGLDGISIEDGWSHRVEACDVYDVGTAGVSLRGGDRKTLTPSNHEAINNHIWRVSRRQRTHAFPLHVGGVGVRVAHNLLNDVPHQAIGLGGNNHVIELNEIHHTGMETDDSGAFYMGRNPSERGTVIRHNFWHDIGSTLSHGSTAVYFDDGAGGQTVYGNVFYRAASGNFGAVFLHGGHDNNVVNNIFVECKKAIGHVPWKDESWSQWLSEPLWQERLLKEVDITRPPYTQQYPDLLGYFDYTVRPRVSYAARNVVVKCGAFVDGNWVEI
ncbi:MAG: right-handed parallel beta-helix repeat-containing protein, partial [FCB group bacterium]|nr:right-handed parallel beta-helix repeat-containing protein [FCB group bacterium]